jgi:hypothetical protein
LWLPPKTKPLRPLAPPLPVQFTVLEEKFVGRTVHDGHVRALTDLEASIWSALPLAVLSNLRVTVTATSHGNPAGEIYGKVIEPVANASGETRIRFTSITPELKAWAAVLASTNAGKKETEATFRPASAVRRASGHSLLRDHEAV